jgi:hypothetical protein
MIRRTEVEMKNTIYMAKDPKDGRHLRKATPAEVAAYKAAQGSRRPAFDEPVRVGDVIIDTYNGPGIWHGGAGF